MRELVAATVFMVLMGILTIIVNGVTGTAFTGPLYGAVLNQGIQFFTGVGVAVLIYSKSRGGD